MGNCGKAVYYATDELGVFKALGEIGYESEILLQQCMPSGDDVRVFILCGEIIGAQKRFQGQDDFRSNIRFGGRDELIVLNDEQLESVQKVIAMLPGNPLETGFICADFLFDDKGNFVLGECNSMPEIKRLRGEKDYEKLECRIISAIDNAAKALEQQNRLYC